VRFQVLTAASMMFRVVFWDVLPCKMIVYRRFRGAYCLHHQGWNHFTRQYISQKTTLNIKSFLAWLQVVSGRTWPADRQLDHTVLQYRRLLSCSVCRRFVFAAAVLSIVLFQGSDPRVATCRGKLQNKRSKLNQEINKELRLRAGAENLFKWVYILYIPGVGTARLTSRTRLAQHSFSNVRNGMLRTNCFILLI